MICWQAPEAPRSKLLLHSGDRQTDGHRKGENQGHDGTSPGHYTGGQSSNPHLDNLSLSVPTLSIIVFFLSRDFFYLPLKIKCYPRDLPLHVFFFLSVSLSAVILVTLNKRLGDENTHRPVKGRNVERWKLEIKN